MYNILKLVDTHPAHKNSDPNLEYENRKKYSDYLRATLSKSELGLLFYNCIRAVDGNYVNIKMTKLVGKYNLLKTLEDEELFQAADYTPQQQRTLFELMKSS